MKSREEYLAQLKAQLDQWNADVSRLEEKARQAQSAMRADYDQRLTALRQQRELVMQKMKGVQSATGEAWKDLVHGTDDAWAKLREALEKARSQFTK